MLALRFLLVFMILPLIMRQVIQMMSFMLLNLILLPVYPVPVQYNLAMMVVCITR